MDKIKVFYAPLENCDGYADYLRRAIVLHVDLTNYPNLHKFIFEHEAKHLEMDLNPLKHIFHDLRDAIRLYRSRRLLEEYWAYNSHKKPKIPFLKHVKYVVCKALYRIIYALTVSPLYILLDSLFYLKARFSSLKNC